MFSSAGKPFAACLDFRANGTPTRLGRPGPKVIYVADAKICVSFCVLCGRKRSLTTCGKRNYETNKRTMTGFEKVVFESSDDHGAKPSHYILEDETYSIVGAALDVYYRLGVGFAEPVYQEALEIEFGLRHIPFEREKWLSINYKGHELRKQYKADFLCYGQVIVELKAQTALTTTDWSQVINYLKASNLRIGLLFNFGHPGKLEKKRLIV